MKVLIDISSGILRGIKEDGNNSDAKKFRPREKKDRIKWLLACLCDESSFLNANGRNGFEKEVEILVSICELKMTNNQLKILCNLIGNFQHQGKRAVAVEAMYALDEEILIELTNMLISGEAYMDTHISYRCDLRYYESIHAVIDYDLYKKLVFETVCKTTVCSSGGVMGVSFNPFKNVYNNLNLKTEDYRELCKMVFA